MCGRRTPAFSSPGRDIPELLKLVRWFRDLETAAISTCDILERSLSTVRELLSKDWEVTTLHGDLHHDNVLDFSNERGWLAIDPKGLIGERGFDFAAMFLKTYLSATLDAAVWGAELAKGDGPERI